MKLNRQLLAEAICDFLKQDVLVTPIAALMPSTQLEDSMSEVWVKCRVAYLSSQKVDELWFSVSVSHENTLVETVNCIADSPNVVLDAKPFREVKLVDTKPVKKNFTDVVKQNDMWRVLKRAKIAQ